MKSKALSVQNQYLRGAQSQSLVARSVATSTAIESGKPSIHYLSGRKKGTSSRTAATTFGYKSTRSSK